jgi:biotin transport system substrate-specific component
LGYLPAVYVIGWISNKSKGRGVLDVLAMVCGSMVIYGCGVSWLKILSGMTLAKTLAVGMYPFILGDGLKIAAAVPIVKALRPIIRTSLGPNHHRDIYENH